MKKLHLLKMIALFNVILLLSGCSIVYINSMTIDEVITSILNTDTNLKTISFDGYSYYLPQGVNLKTNSNLNSILYYNSNKMFMYVDLVSYYHKVENTYTENTKSYYSRRIDIKGKSGYLEINEISRDKYLIEYMYNYSKIEAYSNKSNLNKTLTNISYILNSVKYKDALLDSLVGEGSLKYKEEKFDIFNSNGSDEDLLKYNEQFDKERLNIRDEDILELDEDLK